MTIRVKLKFIVTGCFLGVILSCNPQRQSTEEHRKPNIIFIMVDDLGYGDLGCYGQEVIRTPNLDKLASKGMKFTNFYSGSPVCAPARSVLMTGQHTGHTTVRGNFGKGGVVGLGGGEGRVPLEKHDTTVAEILKAGGYTTAITGKWGLGEPGTAGLPNDQGFDEWFGYLNQRRAHNHYGEYIWRNKEKYEIPQNKDGKEEVYTHNLFTKFTLDFIDAQADSNKPFFIYVPYLLPHAEFEIPELNDSYKDKDWTEEEKVHASMVTLIDEDVGKIMSLLKKKGIENETMVFFTSDNGAARRWEGRFDSSGALRGRKRDVYEGGIRVPMIAALPGTIPEAKVNHTVGYFGDILPTFADLADTEPITNTDGISLKKALLGNDVFGNDRVLYWEFHEQRGKQAVRKGKWKAVRLNVHEQGFHNDIELYNLETNPGETENVAADHPEIVEEMTSIMDKEHQYSDNFPFDFENKEQTM